MRQGDYPGSDIVIEQELEKGSNYRRYYAWYRSEGLKIYGLLTIPLTKMPEGGYPALVFLHGYIEPSAYRTLERYLAYTDWLSRSGYVVFKIDLRGHDRSEGVANGAYSTPGYTVDVLNAVASMQRHPQVNPAKIGMWGHSMGGFLTLRAMVISKQVKAGVIWAGLVCSYPDMIYRWRRSARLLQPLRHRRGHGVAIGSRATARPKRTPNSGIRCLPPASWRICPARCSCITARGIRPCPWCFQKSWRPPSSKPAGRPSCSPTRAITTTCRSPLAPP